MTLLTLLCVCETLQLFQANMAS